MSTTYDLHGKVAIVTGAGSGIGEAAAKRMAEGGAMVLVADLDVDNGQRVANDLGDAGAFFEVNTGKAEQVEAMVAKAVERFGHLDVIVNNAGIGGPQAPTGEYPLDGWQQVMDVNLNGVFYGMRYAIPEMLKRGGGSIVNIASILGSVGFANTAAYVAAKHAVIGMTKSTAIEYSGQGIRANSVGPAFIETPLVKNNLSAEMLQMLEAMHPIGRLGRPEEVGALIAFLASDDASFVTGSYHLVDGAYTAQ
jgi:NAD(P)-dependent dehydrogenase (short-subunit alcohol dehydrogenase family)